MVKRGMAGRGRGGAPPLPRQRWALRIVQVTLAVLAVFVLNLAFNALTSPERELPEALVLAAVGAVAAGWALWMGVRTVRGPQPPSLD